MDDGPLNGMMDEFWKMLPGTVLMLEQFGNNALLPGECLRLELFPVGGKPKSQLELRTNGLPIERGWVLLLFRSFLADASNETSVVAESGPYFLNLAIDCPYTGSSLRGMSYKSKILVLVMGEIGRSFSYNGSLE
jgi:hypothetical protein